MKNLFLLFLLFASCGKTEYKTPTIGMSYADFVSLCGYGPNDDSNAVTNRQGTTFTVTLHTDDERVVYGKNTSSNRNDKGCGGRFTFVDNKLDTMSSR